MLGEILGRDAPNLIAALASFNIGIELGRVAIVAATLLLPLAVTRVSAVAMPPLRTATLGAIGLIAAYWVVDRSLAVV